MRYVIFFFIIQFVSTTSNGQKEVNLGEVNYDSLFNCNDTLSKRPFFERLFNIPVICDSRNDIEIRLNEFSWRGSGQFIIFSYKDGKWDAKKYMNSFGRLGRKQTVVSLDLSVYDGMYPGSHPCLQILNHLIENKIFLIPDQSKDIPLPHGAYFILSYKTNNVFRTYSFQHPDVYFQEHPNNNNKEYLYLKEIIKTLQEMFDNI